MKVVIIGKGLAGHGLVEALLTDKKSLSLVKEIFWYGPEMTLENQRPWQPCSLNTTSLVALQGIERDVSPLGDLLVESFDLTKEFIKNYQPKGVTNARRFHFPKENNSNEIQKLKDRFGDTQSFSEIFPTLNIEGVIEEAYLFDPPVFFKWWDERLNSLANDLGITLKRFDALVGNLNQEKKTLTVIGEKEEVNFNLAFLSTGALTLDLPVQREEEPIKGKKVVGHYFKKVLKSDFPLSNESMVLTIGGHNLIYNSSNKSVIIGGSNEGEGPLAPNREELEEQIDCFVSFFPELRDCLTFSSKEIFTGTRYKAPKRTAFVKQHSDSIIEVNGFYKNGWSVCHSLPKSAMHLWFRKV